MIKRIGIRSVRGYVAPMYEVTVGGKGIKDANGDKFLFTSRTDASKVASGMRASRRKSPKVKRKGK